MSDHDLSYFIFITEIFYVYIYIYICVCVCVCGVEWNLTVWKIRLDMFFYKNSFIKISLLLLKNLYFQYKKERNMSEWRCVKVPSYFVEDGPVSLGCRICWVQLCREYNSLPLQMLWIWHHTASEGEASVLSYGVLLHYHNSQVHTDLEWEYLLESYLLVNRTV